MPRQGPRRPVLAARIDPEDAEWVDAQVRNEKTTHAEFVRRLVRFARMNMPAYWRPPESKG